MMTESSLNQDSLSKGCTVDVEWCGSTVVTVALGVIYEDQERSVRTKHSDLVERT